MVCFPAVEYVMCAPLIYLLSSHLATKSLEWKQKQSLEQAESEIMG